MAVDIANLELARAGGIQGKQTIADLLKSFVDVTKTGNIFDLPAFKGYLQQMMNIAQPQLFNVERNLKTQGVQGGAYSTALSKALESIIKGQLGAGNEWMRNIYGQIPEMAGMQEKSYLEEEQMYNKFLEMRKARHQQQSNLKNQMLLSGLTSAFGSMANPLMSIFGNLFGGGGLKQFTGAMPAPGQLKSPL